MRISKKTNDAYACPVCSFAHDSRCLDIRLPYPDGNLEIYRCVCGLGYSNYALSGVTAEVYDSTYYDHIRYSDSSRQGYVGHLVPYFKKAVEAAGLSPERRRLLDIGCATGDFLEYATRSGWEAEGVDISGFAVACCRERGLKATVCPIEKLSDLGSTYDVITMWDVIEHLPDMVQAMRAVSERLTRGGVVVLKTVSRRSVVDYLARAVYTGTLHAVAGPLKRMYVPGHLYYFTPYTLRSFLAKFGETLFIAYTDTPPDALHASAAMRTTLRGIFSIQRAFRMSYELISAWTPRRAAP